MPDSPSSRRSLLLGGAALTGTLASQAVLAGPADAVTVNPYRKTAAPSAWQRHLMNRMGCGYSRATFAQMREAGSASAWFKAQLSPSSVPESAKGKAVPTWFPDLDEAVTTKWQKNASGVKGGWQYAADLAGYSMLRRVYSTRQVLETMVDFWSNHLHVHADTDLGWVHRASYDRLIRKHALGRFDDMLVAASLHPAMLLYLDNWRSVKNAPNENQGRELLELHTVGRAAGYTEQMVKDSAKILSGWTVDAFDSWEGYYDAGRHTTGPVQVLGFTSANSSPDGSAVTKDYLRYLAHHPATALTIARKLARHFVADDPSTALVTHLASVFRSSGTDIKATLRALVAHDDFKASAGRLVRTPIEDFVATCRVLGVNVASPHRRRLLRPCGDLGPPDHAALPVAAAGRFAVRRRRVVLGDPDAQLVPDALGPDRRLVADQGRDLPEAGVVAAAEADPARPVRRPPLPDGARQAVELADPVRRGRGRRLRPVEPSSPPTSRQRLAVRAPDGRAARLPRPHATLTETDR